MSGEERETITQQGCRNKMMSDKAPKLQTNYRSQTRIVKQPRRWKKLLEKKFVTIAKHI